jgi:hypothetical protein
LNSRIAPCGVTPEGGVRFSSRIVIVSSFFAPSQVFTFGSLDYIADYDSKLYPLEETSLEDNESPVSYPLLVLVWMI